MLAAPLCVLVHHRRTSWWVALTVAWASFANSVVLARKVFLDGPVSYYVGGWEPPWGIELRIDELNAFVLCLVSGICAVVLVAAPRSFDTEFDTRRHHLAYGAYLLCMTGLMGIASAGDAFNVFVFLEISSLSSYGLIALGPSRRALTSALRYLIVGTLGGTFIMLGVGLLYMSTGTLNLVDLAQRIPQSDGQRTIVVAMVFLVVGACIKAGPVSAPRLAARCLRLRALGGDRIPRRHRHQSGVLRVGALPVQRLRLRHQRGQISRRMGTAGIGPGRHGLWRRGSGIRERRQAHARLLQPVADRLHGGGSGAGHKKAVSPAASFIW